MEAILRVVMAKLWVGASEEEKPWRLTEWREKARMEVSDTDTMEDGTAMEGGGKRCKPR